MSLRALYKWFSIINAVINQWTVCKSILAIAQNDASNLAWMRIPEMNFPSNSRSFYEYFAG